MTPQEASNYFESKGYRFSWNYWEVQREEHDQAFTVAKAIKGDILTDIREAVENSLKLGISIDDFRASLTPILIEKGWWTEVIEPGEPVLGTPWRLNTIFRTNVQSSYMVGRWREQSDPVVSQARPFLKYSSVVDDRTRPDHLGWNGTILPIDDPWWDTHYPTNGYNCRCGVISYSDSEMERGSLQVSKRPKDEMVEWRNPRSGKVEMVPKGIDPGFDRNPGKDRWEPEKQNYDEDIWNQMEDDVP